MGTSVGDCRGGLRGEEREHLLVLAGKVRHALLSGEEEVAHVHAAMAHRGALEGLRAHQVGGEAERAHVGREVGEAHRSRQVAQVGEEPGTVGPLGKLALLLGSEAGGDELAHLARLVHRGDDAVARGGQRAGGVDRLLQHGGEVEARTGAQDGRSQRADTRFLKVRFGLVVRLSTDRGLVPFSEARARARHSARAALSGDGEGGGIHT